MQTAKLATLKVSVVALIMAMFGAFTVPMQGQGPTSTVEDWSHHRLIFSDPGTAENAKANGHYAEWSRTVNSARYQLQQRRRSGIKPFIDTGHGVRSTADWGYLKNLDGKGKGIHTDWSEALLAGGQVQPNAYPAKFSFSTTTASCANDYVVYPTGVEGTAAKANLIAYNNLYVGTGGCETTNPTVLFAYNVETASATTNGMISTSPVIYNDATGSQIAFVETTGTTAYLTIVRRGGTAGTLTAPTVPTVETTVAAFRSCTVPCSYSVSLGANDTFSAPFYDYETDDAVYVGDDSGKLHKITGVFAGTSTIAEASGWPVTLDSGVKTTSPVYDNSSGYVFAGNMAAILYSVGTGNAGTTNAAINSGATTLGGTGAAIMDAPLVDSASQNVYAFVSNTTGGNNEVYQFLTTNTSGFTTANATSSEAVGTGATQDWLYDGDFDNVYYLSTGGVAGDLWVVGNTGNTTLGSEGANLYRITIGATGLMTGSTAAVSRFTTHSTTVRPWPSPVTEFCNNAGAACTSSGTATSHGTDYLYFSVDELNSATGTSCATGSITDGCVLAYDVTTPANTPTLVEGAATTTAGTNGCWSTGGIVIDNSVPSGTQVGASEIYWFALNGNGAGGPALGTYTSTGCTNVDTATPNALQDLQTL